MRKLWMRPRNCLMQAQDPIRRKYSCYSLTLTQQVYILFLFKKSLNLRLLLKIKPISAFQDRSSVKFNFRVHLYNGMTYFYHYRYIIIISLYHINPVLNIPMMIYGGYIHYTSLDMTYMNPRPWVGISDIHSVTLYNLYLSLIS